MPSPSPRPRAAASAFYVFRGCLAAVHCLSLVVLTLSAACGCWANLPSVFVFAVGSGITLANASSFDLST